MSLGQCIFSGNGNGKGADVFRAGKGTNFRITGCTFDRALPDAAYCEFVVAATHANGRFDPLRCQAPQDSGRRREPSFELESASPPSEGLSRSSNTVVAIGYALAGAAAFLSITVFLYVLCRSRTEEKNPDYDAVCESKEEEPVSETIIAV
jgi:hypothetical protein